MNLSGFEPFLESLAKGPVLRKTLALTLRILAAVLILAGLFMALGTIGQIINVIRIDAAEALGGLLSLVLIVAGFFLAVKVVLFRAKSILTSSESEYPIVSLSLLLLRTAGELLALFYSVFGFISGITIWFGGEFPFLPSFWRSLFLPGIPAFILGLGIILASLLQAILMLLAFYLLAELLLLLRDLATNCRR